jgi:uncharacterized protein (TIGR02145 family)
MNRKIFIFCLMVFAGLTISSCAKEEEKRPDPMELEMQVQHASTYNAKDGAVNINIIKGDPPFIFHWNTGDTTRNISGLGAGEYTVKIVYGVNGVSFYEQSAVIEQPEAEPLALVFTAVDADAYGKPTGSVSVAVSGGVPPYRYQWSTGATTAQVDGLFAGVYSVTVTDSGVPFSITNSGSAVVGQPGFVCEQDSIRDIDGNLYSTLLINDVCWLGENLRTTHRPDSPAGELIPIEGRLCRGLFCEGKEGAHYTWQAAMNGSAGASEPDEKIQGVCPTGWYLPTREVFEDLDNWLSVDGNGGPGFFSGAKMKGENSSSGYDALFTGNWGFGIYTQAPYAGFWTSTESVTNPANARMIYLTQDTPFMNAANQPKGYGFNVRCIKDEEMP